MIGKIVVSRITTGRHRTGCAGISCCARSASGSARTAPPAARKSSASGSHWTLRWREMDSNFQFRADGAAGRSADLKVRAGLAAGGSGFEPPVPRLG